MLRAYSTTAVTMEPRIQAFFDSASCTYSYVVFEHEGSQCAIIDCVLNYDHTCAHTSTTNADEIAAFVIEHGLRPQWLLETPSVNSGASTITLHNTGNFMRNIIFVARNAAGARTEADWPALTEFILDNDSMFYLPKDDWRFAMRRQFGLSASALDAANGIDSGVFVLPFDTLVGSLSGDPANSRSQYLPTLDSSQLQIKGSAFGAGISTVEILTNNITPSSSGDVFSK